MGFKFDLAPCICRHLESIMNRICGPWRYEPRVHDRATGPGVALVNWISMGIHLQGTIKMRALLHWAFSTVFHPAAPEHNAAFVVGGFQFQPCIVGVNRASGEEVAHLAR